MNATATIHRRTFEAARFPKGSTERETLNKDVLTSEYMPSYRYLLRRPFLMSDGTPHPTQKYLDVTFTTRAEADAAANALRILSPDGKTNVAVAGN